jgi:hypothetical protein
MMSMKMKSTYKDEVQNLALETVWSLWSEAGLSGWARHHADTAIDVEPLIIATAWLGQFDARLLEEAFDWCVLNSRFVSAVRLRNLLATVNDPVRNAFGAFSATVRSRKKVSWPGTGRTLELSVTHRSTVPDLRRPALLQLRLRAVFGVTARAEILRRMLPEPSRFFGIAELALHAAYGKDNVADALDLLSLAAITTETTMTSAGTQSCSGLTRPRSWSHSSDHFLRINRTGQLAFASCSGWSTLPPMLPRTRLRARQPSLGCSSSCSQTSAGWGRFPSCGKESRL